MPAAGTEDEAQTERQHHHGELRLADDASEHDGVEREAEGGGEQDGEQRADPVVQAEMRDQGEREEAAQHHDVALGEVDHLGRLVDQDESERDQPIDAAGGGAIDDKLQQARSVFHDQAALPRRGRPLLTPRV